MANTFKNALSKNVSTSLVTVYTPPSAQTSILIELDVANQNTTTAITVDTVITKSGTDYYVVRSAPIAVGGSLQVVNGQKIVLEYGDEIKVRASVANSADVIASILQDV
jgi:hypothetical protein